MGPGRGRLARGPSGRQWASDAEALVVLGVLSVLASGVGQGLGQGLGDSARREREKRAQRGEVNPRVPLTNEDLSREKTGSESDAAADADSAAPAASAAHAPAPAPAASAADASGEHAAVPPAGPGPRAEDARAGDPLEQERQERALQEAEWRTRFANAREQLAFAEAGAWRNAYRIEIVAGVPMRVPLPGAGRDGGADAGSPGPRRPRGGVPAHGFPTGLGSPGMRLRRAVRAFGRTVASLVRLRGGEAPPLRWWPGEPC